MGAGSMIIATITIATSIPIITVIMTIIILRAGGWETSRLAF